MPASDSIIIVDGSLEWSGGVDSIKVTTVASEPNPGGLRRDQLAWLINATVRDGGITQRSTWQPVGFMHAGDALYQGGFMYDPIGDNPYLVHGIGGILYREDMSTGALTPLSSDPTLYHPPAQEMFFFAQAEEFLVVQAGDNVTNPLIWDGTTLIRSRGITGDSNPVSANRNQIPPATCMDYFMGRLWYAQGRVVSAGDIVNGASGTAPYNNRDAVIYVTENPLAIGGDGFTVASNDGNVRALKHSANLDAALGQGRLFIFTRKATYALNVPVTRINWIAADNDNQPLMTVVQLVNGSVNDRSVVAVNGDLFFTSLEPGIRSLLQAVRYFQQWGLVDISSNENRVLQFNDRSLLRAATGIAFNNRLLMSSLPFQTAVGIAHSAIVPLDFIPISSFNRQKEPNWEGVYDGLDILQLFVGDFGGLERAFAVVLSRTDGTINLWEFSEAERFENGDQRVQWQIEFPAFNWSRPFDLKRLVSAEIFVDRLFGTVNFELDYRPDSQTCWNPWHKWKACSPRNSSEDCLNPITYPITEYGTCYKYTMVMPRPPETCAECATGRPAPVGYQHQIRLTIKGFTRIRGLLLHAQPEDRQLYRGITC